MTARLIVASLALGVLLGAAGCGASNAPQPADAKDKDKKPDAPPLSVPNQTGPQATQPPGTTPAVPQASGPGVMKLGHDAPAVKAAEAAVRDLLAGQLGPDRVSARYLRVIARPNPENPDDVKQGFSGRAAHGWATRAAAAVGGVGPVSGYSVPGTAILTGPVIGSEKGRYLMRLVEESGAWKVDWFQAAAVQAELQPDPANPDALRQDFAAAAFLDAVADRKAMTPDDRAALVAALIAPGYRKALDAEPFGSDAKLGFDYSPAKLKAALADLPAPGTAVVSYTQAAAAGNTVTGEFTLAGGAKRAYTLKLAPDADRGWVVEAFTVQ